MLLFLSSKYSVQIRQLLHQHAGIIAVYWGSPRPLRLYLDSVLSTKVWKWSWSTSSYLHFILFIVQPFLRSNIKELMNFTSLLVLAMSCFFGIYIPSSLGNLIQLVLYIVYLLVCYILLHHICLWLDVQRHNNL